MIPKVVIIGGSHAGLKALATVYKQGAPNQVDVTLVAPSTHAFFNIAAPRLLSEPERFDETVTPIADLVAKASKASGKFLRGSATAVDFSKREVSVATPEHGETKLNYDILVLATGTEVKWSGYKVCLDHAETKAALLAAAKSLKSAKSVAVVGGGPTGVETAGEVAKEFAPAKVVLYTGGSAPLKTAAPLLTEKVSQKLEDLGVEIVNDTRIKAVELKGKQGASESSVVLANGEKRGFDVIFESYVVAPFSKFLPAAVKDERGYVKTNAMLQVKDQRGVLAFGDLVSGSSNSIVDLRLGQSKIFSSTILKLLRDVKDPSFWTDPKFAVDANSLYKPITNTLMVLVTRDGGAGMAFGWSLPNGIVWLAKSKNYMIERARDFF